MRACILVSVARFALDREGLRDGVIFRPDRAFSHELCELIFTEGVAQRGEHLVALLLFGVLTQCFQRIQARVDVAQEPRGAEPIPARMRG